MRKIILINAIVWAALILVNSFLFKDHDNWKYMFLFLISGFTIVNSLLLTKHKRKTTCK